MIRSLLGMIALIALATPCPGHSASESRASRATQRGASIANDRAPTARPARKFRAYLIDSLTDDCTALMAVDQATFTPLTMVEINVVAIGSVHSVTVNSPVLGWQQAPMSVIDNEGTLWDALLIIDAETDRVPRRHCRSTRCVGESTGVSIDNQRRGTNPIQKTIYNLTGELMTSTKEKTRDDIVARLYDIQHDLAKYIRMPLTYLPSHATNQDLREALQRSLRETYTRNGRVIRAAELWAECKSELPQWVRMLPAYQRTERAVANALAWEGAIDNEHVEIDRKHLLSDFNAIGGGIDLLIADVRGAQP